MIAEEERCATEFLGGPGLDALGPSGLHVLIDDAEAKPMLLLTHRVLLLPAVARPVR